MAFKILDRVKMSVTGVPGTGDVTVSAPLSGYQSLVQSGLNDGDTFAYSIVEGNNWEFGVGTYTSAGTKFSRNVTKTSAQNSNPLNFTGNAVVTAVLRAEDLGGGKLSGLTDVTVNPADVTNGAPLVWDAYGQAWVAGALSNLTVVIPNTFFPVDGTSWPNINVLDFNSTDFAIDPPAGGRAKIRLASSGSNLGVVEVRNNGSLVGQFNTLNFMNPASTVSGVGSSFPNMVDITFPSGGGASTLATLTDVNVTEGSGIDGYVLKWDNATSKWVASATGGGFSGAYSDLTGKPTLFSGAYTDLTGKPTLFSGSYTDLTSKPTIPTTLETLTDVNVTTGSGINGYSLTWSNSTGKWVATNVSGGGGGATALSGLSDVTLSSVTTGQVLAYNGSAWVNTTPSSGGGGGGAGGTAPTVVQVADYNGSGSADVTLGSAPTSGNLLVAIGFSTSGSFSAGSGWTLATSSANGMWYQGIAYKVAGGSESATQTPFGNTTRSTAMWEVNGQNGSAPVLSASLANLSGAAVGAVPVVPAPVGSLMLALLIQQSFAIWNAAWGLDTLDHRETNASNGSPAYGHSSSDTNKLYSMGASQSGTNGYIAATVLVVH